MNTASLFTLLLLVFLLHKQNAGLRFTNAFVSKSTNCSSHIANPYRRIFCDDNFQIFITHHRFGYQSCEESSVNFVDNRHVVAKQCNTNMSCVVDTYNGTIEVYKTLINRTNNIFRFHIRNMLVYQCIPGNHGLNFFDICENVNTSGMNYASLKTLRYSDTDLCRCRVEGGAFNVRILERNTRQIKDLRFESRQKDICDSEINSAVAYNNELQCLKDQNDVEVEFMNKRGNKIWLEVAGEINSIRCGSAFQTYVPTMVESKESTPGTSSTTNVKNNTPVIIVAIVGLVVVMTAVIVVSLMCRKRKRSRLKGSKIGYRPSDNSGNNFNTQHTNDGANSGETYMNIQDTMVTLGPVDTHDDPQRLNNIVMPQDQDDDGVYNVIDSDMNNQITSSETGDSAYSTTLRMENKNSTTSEKNIVVATSGNSSYIGPQGDIYAAVVQRNDIPIHYDTPKVNVEDQSRLEGPKGDVYTMVSLKRR